MSDAVPDPAVDTARRFVDAVAWGEHLVVWELLAPQGRETVLKVALARGMTEELADQLRQGTASEAQRDEFLADLVNGLRADLSGPDLDDLDYELDSAPLPPGHARVKILARMHEILGGTLPAATAHLTRADDSAEWRVERLVPQATRA